MSKNLTPAAFLALINKSTRTPADVASASHFLRRNAYHAASWVWTRTTVDGADGATVADEADVTTSRISQIKAGMRLMHHDAGIPMPTTVAEATVCEATYGAISRAYKSGKTARAALKDAAKRAAAVTDVTAKHETMAAVQPVADDNKRAARPGGTTDTDTDDGQNNGTPAVGGTVPTEAPSTVLDRMRAILADVKSGQPIADLTAAQELADQISDAIAERAGLTVDA